MSTPNYFVSLFANKCPHCREGNLFVHPNPYAFNGILKMHEHCTVCGQKTTIETGFWYGTGYVSYALSIAVTATTFVMWYVLLGFTLENYHVFYWFGLNALLLGILQPYMMRFSRTMWLSMFVTYDPEAKKNHSLS
jgi:uncharacterized protein (DUF983 family)